MKTAIAKIVKKNKMTGRKIKGTIEMHSYALQLRTNGATLRKISRELLKKFNVNIAPATIANWDKHYSLNIPVDDIPAMKQTLKDKEYERRALVKRLACLKIEITRTRAAITSSKYSRINEGLKRLNIVEQEMVSIKDKFINM